MVKYDPKVIQEHANQLYRQAAMIVFLAALIGVLVGAGGAVSLIGRNGITEPAHLIPLAIGAVVGGGIGLAIGRSMAFGLKLRAQLALCQVQIERHTRHTHATVYAMLPQSQGAQELDP